MDIQKGLGYLPYGFPRKVLTLNPNQGETVDAKPKPRVIPTEHTFALDKPCIVKEAFYVSDTLTESHWQVHSTKNKGKFDLAGTFVLDLSDWREKGLMQRRTPEPGKYGQEHWAVQFDIVMELVGRMIYCSARYPSSGEIGESTGEPIGEKLSGSQIEMNIAAAFEPGTK